MKDIVSSTQFNEGLAQLQTPAELNITQQVRVPVQVVIGAQDFLLCGGTLDCTSQPAVRANEAPYFSNAPSLRADVISGTGHDLNLHTTLDATFARINNWLQN